MEKPVFAAEISTGWRLSIWAQPGAKKTELAGMHGDRLKIRVQARAVDNKANETLRGFIASQLGLRTSEVCVASGQTSRRKTVQICTQEEPVWENLLP